jgi:hypothetical protein
MLIRRTASRWSLKHGSDRGQQVPVVLTFSNNVLSFASSYSFVASKNPRTALARTKLGAFDYVAAVACVATAAAVA